DQEFEEHDRRKATMETLTLEEYMKDAREEYGWRVIEPEVLNLLMIKDDLFTWETPLGMIFNEFKKLSRMSDDLFTYDVKLQEVSLPLIGDEQCDDLKYDHDRYIQRISYEEYEKIYVEVEIVINKKLVRLIDVTMEQWLDLKYGDHMTVDENIKKGVIATWLIRSYKWQFEDYLEIKKDRDTYAREIDMEYNPSNVVFAEWRALKLHTTWRWIGIPRTGYRFTRQEGMMKWIETDLFNFETPLCEAFNEFNYLLKIETGLHTNDIPGFKTYDEFKDEWMDWRNEETPCDLKVKECGKNSGKFVE
ncbi:hypothetical protein Tco_0724635, partial [Tanacetum coccineum]